MCLCAPYEMCRNTKTHFPSHTRVPCFGRQEWQKGAVGRGGGSKFNQSHVGMGCRVECSPYLFGVAAHKFCALWSMLMNFGMSGICRRTITCVYKFSYGWLIRIVVHPSHPQHIYMFASNAWEWLLFATHNIWPNAPAIQCTSHICSISMLLMWCVSARFRNVRDFRPHIYAICATLWARNVPFPIQHSCKNTAAINCKSTNKRVQNGEHRRTLVRRQTSRITMEPNRSG